MNKQNKKRYQVLEIRLAGELFYAIADAAENDRIICQEPIEIDFKEQEVESSNFDTNNNYRGRKDIQKIANLLNKVNGKFEQKK